MTRRHHFTGALRCGKGTGPGDTLNFRMNEKKPSSLSIELGKNRMSRKSDTRLMGYWFVGVVIPVMSLWTLAACGVFASEVPQTVVPTQKPVAAFVDLHADKVNVEVGEQVSMDLSITTSLATAQRGQDVDVNLLLHIPSGITMSEFGRLESKDCSGGQCNAVFKMVAGEQRNLPIKITPNHLGEFEMRGTVELVYEDTTIESLAIPNQLIRVVPPDLGTPQIVAASSQDKSEVPTFLTTTPAPGPTPVTRDPIIQTVIVEKQVEVPVIHTVIVEKQVEVQVVHTVIVEKEVPSGTVIHTVIVEKQVEVQVVHTVIVEKEVPSGTVVQTVIVEKQVEVIVERVVEVEVPVVHTVVVEIEVEVPVLHTVVVEK